jgi:hypothetical protein
VPPAPEQTTIEQVQGACEQLARSLCARQSACDAPVLGLGRRFESELSCRDAYRVACTIWSASSDSGLSPARVSACATEIDGVQCRAIEATLYTSVSSLPWCLTGFGARDIGQSCRLDSECGSGTCSGTLDAAGCRKCTAPPAWVSSYAYEGEACDATRFCASFLRCESAVCARPVCDVPGCLDYGAACGGLASPASVCPRGTQCTNMNDLGTGQCKAYAAAGETCDPFTGPLCGFPSSCEAGICVLPVAGSCP